MDNTDKWFLTENGKKQAEESFKKFPKETQELIIKIAKRLEELLKENK